MRFRFRLEKILGVSELKEKMKKMEVAQARKRISDLEIKKEDLKRTIRELLVDSQMRASLREWDTYRIEKIETNRQGIEETEQDMIQEQDVLQGKLFELQRLRQRRQALEALKEKKRIEFRREENKKEQKRLDDILRSRSVVFEEDF